MARKCRCAHCGQRFPSVKLREEHKKKYPNASCKDVDFNVLEELKGGEGEMFRKKKEESVAPPTEEVVVEDVQALKERIAELEAGDNKPTAVPEIAPAESIAPQNPVQPEEELTEEMAKQVLKNHEERLQKVEYNLRLIP